MFTGLVASRRVQKAALRTLTTQHIVNTSVADVPGPPKPLSLAGARLIEVFPLVPLLGNVTLGSG
jgi:diacylglycerol O-acyltransferase / wax synthase